MAYFIGEYRILTPLEVFKLYMTAEKLQSKIEFMFYVSTGMRYNEGGYVLDNFDKIDFDERVIHYESNKKWDKERIWKDRDVYLSYWDMLNVFNFISVNSGHKINPIYANLTRNLYNWANANGMGSKGLGARCVRKTRFVWLLKAFPESEESIIKSMDYDPVKNATLGMNDDALELYKGVPFTEKEVKLVKALLHGWSGELK